MSVYYLVPTLFYMTKLTNTTEAVEEFLKNLAHPFKKEIEMIREIILSVDPGIVEQIKWAAPSFAYQDIDFVTFNLWEKKRIHLIFPNPEVTRIRSTLLEGQFEKRRMAYFADMKDIHAKKEALAMVVKELVELIKFTNP